MGRLGDLLLLMQLNKPQQVEDIQDSVEVTTQALVPRWKTKSPEIFNQSPVVRNTWYTAFTATVDTKVNFVAVYQENNGAAAEDVAVRFTVDGVVFEPVASVAQNDLTYYYWYITATSNGKLTGVTNETLAKIYESWQGLNWTIEVRQTSVVDPVASALNVVVVYEQI